MDAHQGRRGVNVAHDEGNEAFDFAAGVGVRRVLVAGARHLKRTLEAEDAEVAPAAGKVRFGDLLYSLKSHASILRCLRVEAAIAVTDGELAALGRTPRDSVCWVECMDSQVRKSGPFGFAQGRLWGTPIQDKNERRDMDRRKRLEIGCSSPRRDTLMK